jgi:hypothetical protein
MSSLVRFLVRHFSGTGELREDEKIPPAPPQGRPRYENLTFKPVWDGTPQINKSLCSIFDRTADIDLKGVENLF